MLHHLPGVGKNLQDHLQARPVFKCRASTINTEIKNMFQLAAIAFQYALNRSGPMAMAASLGTGFLKTRAELERPDSQFHIQPFSADSQPRVALNFRRYRIFLQLRPESTGRIALGSASPYDYPLSIRIIWPPKQMLIPWWLV